MSESGKDIAYAKKLLLDSQVVGIPTETVYGLAGSAYNEKAILSIFEIKKRPKFDPLIVHTNSIGRIAEFVEYIPQKAQKLFEAFSPGAITILLPKRNNIPDLVTSGLPNVAVRIPNHPLTLSLLESLPFPLAAPSANPFGYISPTSAQHVQDQLGGKINYILDGGECTIGLESTIVGFEDNQLIMYRLGGIAISDIEKVAGKVHLINTSDTLVKSAGMLSKHYSPKKKFVIGNIAELKLNYNKNVAIISFSTVYEDCFNLVLSQSGNMDEAARNLFAYLRILDEKENIEVIIGEWVPNVGLGMAINDRLKRASAKS